MARTALYRYFDAEGTLLYVGVTDDPAIRDLQHSRTASWIGSAARMTTEWLASREHALALEMVAIRFEKPLHNAKGVVPDYDCEDAVHAELAEAVRNDGRSMRQISLAAGLGPNFLQQALRNKKDPGATRLAAIMAVLRKREAA